MPMCVCVCVSVGCADADADVRSCCRIFDVLPLLARLEMTSTLEFILVVHLRWNWEAGGERRGVEWRGEGGTNCFFVL